MQGLFKKYIETSVHIKILFYFFLFNSDKRKDIHTEFIGNCLKLFSFCFSQNSICKIPKSRRLERVEGQSNSLFMVSPSVSSRNEFKDSFDQLIDVSVGFFWILLPFFVYLFSPRKSVSPRAEDLEVRDVVVQGVGVDLGMFIGERGLTRLFAFG